MKKIILLFILLVSSNAFANPYTMTNDIDLVLKEMKYSGRHEFEVSVNGGTVTVEGYVSSQQDKARVERAVYTVNGVSNVINKLRIAGESAVSVSPTAKIIRDRIKADPGINNYNLDIAHSGNVITITGEVDKLSDKERIFQIASDAAPAAQIENNLQVNVKASEPDNVINERVLAALKTESVNGLDSVVINTKDGVVIFSGQVENHRQIDRMLSIALMVEGVKSVRSEVKTGSAAKK